MPLCVSTQSTCLCSMRRLLTLDLLFQHHITSTHAHIMQAYVAFDHPSPFHIGSIPAKPGRSLSGTIQTATSNEHDIIEYRTLYQHCNRRGSSELAATCNTSSATPTDRTALTNVQSPVSPFRQSLIVLGRLQGCRRSATKLARVAPTRPTPS